MKKALIVGINNYDFAPLKGCVRDATDFSRLIESNGDGSLNFHVRLEPNVSRKHTLRAMIAELFRDKNETALFYFSGHGFVNELGGFLVMPDYREHDEGISMNDILTLANNSPSTNKIIILDCCHSGAITAPAHSFSTTGHINEGITILTASKREQVAIEVAGKGVFTNLLLEALKGGAADLNGHITPGSIYAYIDQALGPWDQRPVFKTNVSRFTPLRQVPARIPLPMLRNLTRYFMTPEAEHQLDPSYEYTNDPETEHTYTTPFAQEAQVAIFKELQEMHSAGLVEPLGDQHLYWAAMNSKSCRLTPLGAHYWRLVHERRI